MADGHSEVVEERSAGEERRLRSTLYRGNRVLWIPIEKSGRPEVKDSPVKDQLHASDQVVDQRFPVQAELSELGEELFQRI